MKGRALRSRGLPRRRMLGLLSCPNVKKAPVCAVYDGPQVVGWTCTGAYGDGADEPGGRASGIHAFAQ
jgi:hypothetical protein